MMPNGEKLRTNVATGAAGVDSVAEEWEAMYGRNGRKSPFHSIDYVRLWYDCFSTPEQARIYRVTCHGETIGFLPLVLNAASRIRVLSGLTNAHSYHSAALVREGFENVFPDCLARELHRDAQAWDVLTHGCSYSFSNLPQLLPEEGMNGYGMTLRRNVQKTYSVAFAKSFPDYFQQDLSSKTRNCLRKYSKRISEGKVGYLRYRGEEGVERFPDFLHLEDSGWKGAACSSIRRLPPGYHTYYQRLTRLLAERDSLALYFLEYDGKPIAGLFGYEEMDTFHSFKIAYDEDFSSFAPSNLLFLHVVEDLMTHRPGIRRFHMFPSDAGYKHRFANEEAVCEETVVFSSTLRGRAMRRSTEFREYVRELPGVRPLVKLVRERCR